jgi:uncharacterized protein (TIGR03083 family)
MGTNPWPLIHAERNALVGDLVSLNNDQWATPSLCDGWTVRDVFGHLTATAKLTPAKFLVAFAGSGFRFNDMAAKLAAAETAVSPADGLAEFRAHLTATIHPPGPAEAMLGEAVIHGEDIRRPLGITRNYPQEAVTRAADFFKGSNLLIGTKNRIAGLSLRATDAGWSTGTGPEVAGPVLSLLLVMTGRAAALDDLSGDGVAVLRERMRPGERP